MLGQESLQLTQSIAGASLEIPVDILMLHIHEQLLSQIPPPGFYEPVSGQVAGVVGTG